MSDSERQRELLREVVADGHRESRERVPRFDRMWARAAAEARPRGAGRRRLGLAAAAATLLLGLATLPLWNAHRQSREIERAMNLAAALGEWRAPTDFLLETPGREWLATTPSWPARPDAPGWGLDPGLLEPGSAPTETAPADSPPDSPPNPSPRPGSS